MCTTVVEDVFATIGSRVTSRTAALCILPGALLRAFSWFKLPWFEFKQPDLEILFWRLPVGFGSQTVSALCHGSGELQSVSGID